MNDTKKVILEHGDQDKYKRITLEQGTTENTNTPKWNILTANVKEKTAGGITAFSTSFISVLAPASIVGIIVITIFLWLICN